MLRGGAGRGGGNPPIGWIGSGRVGSGGWRLAVRCCLSFPLLSFSGSLREGGEASCKAPARVGCGLAARVWGEAWVALAMGVVWVGARGFEEGVEVVLGRLELSRLVWFKLALGDGKVVAGRCRCRKDVLCVKSFGPGGHMINASQR